jgi:hypothetical protein
MQHFLLLHVSLGAAPKAGILVACIHSNERRLWQSSSPFEPEEPRFEFEEDRAKVWEVKELQAAKVKTNMLHLLPGNAQSVIAGLDGVAAVSDLLAALVNWVLPLGGGCNC